MAANESHAAADDDDVQALFREASSRVKEISSKLSEEQLLQFYGLYKQSVEGPCTKPKPSWFQMTEKQKWQAWSSLNNMDSKEAMRKYIDLLNGLDENWQTDQADDTSSGWIHHSTMKNTDEDIEDSVKTVFDWVKEGNFEQFKCSLRNEFDLTKSDEDGLSLLHWAADRGNLEIVRHLVQHCDVDVNVRDTDGQTPLHYASSCGHEEVVKFLIELGADSNVRDSDDQTPYDVADSSNIKRILKT